MATERCQPIRDNIRKTEEAIREAEELLPELVGPVKVVIVNFIKREKGHLAQLKAALRVCQSTK